MEVRTENAALKRKEVEISKAQATNRVEKINSEYDAITKENSEPEKPHSPEQKQKKRREARRVIVTEVSSASDDDVEIVLPRPKLLKPPTAQQIAHQRTAIKMSAYE
jgi:hypothetical protein